MRRFWSRAEKVGRVMASGGYGLLTQKRPPANPPPKGNGVYEWGWFEPNDEYDGSDFPVPARGAYGVRQGYNLVCLTSRYGEGYNFALVIAAALNQGQKGEEGE